MLTPPAGAASLRDTLHKSVPGDDREGALQERALSVITGALTAICNWATLETPLYVAVRSTLPAGSPADTLALKPTVVLPAGTTSEAGTETPALLLVN